jgi:hypothetical protein
VPVFVTVPTAYENTEAGISGLPAVDNGLTKTCDIHPVLVPRVSVTATADPKWVVNVAGKVTLLPRFRFVGAEIESRLLVTVRVKVVVAAYAEIVPINGDAMMSDRANTLYFKGSFMCVT